MDTPESHQDGETLALTVGAGGAVALIGGWILRSDLLRALGLIATVAGGGLYAREKLAERGEKIQEAETKIRSQLDKLDPVARAQVLLDMAKPKPEA
jgi:hypothetical protein